MERFFEILRTKPHYDLAEDHPLKPVYDRLNVGSRIVISSRWFPNDEGKNPYAGEKGEVIGFSLGLQGVFNVDYLNIHYMMENWEQRSAWLYTVDLEDPVSAVKAN